VKATGEVPEEEGEERVGRKGRKGRKKEMKKESHTCVLVCSTAHSKAH
jgi:hypothetical protein